MWIDIFRERHSVPAAQSGCALMAQAKGHSGTVLCTQAHARMGHVGSGLIFWLWPITSVLGEAPLGGRP